MTDFSTALLVKQDLFLHGSTRGENKSGGEWATDSGRNNTRGAGLALNKSVKTRLSVT